MSWNWAALMPHPPIIVPEVGCGREQEAAVTLTGLEQLIARLAALGSRGKPDCLLLLSPHQPQAQGSLALNIAPRISGSLAPFGAPSISFTLETPREKAAALAAHLRTAGVSVTFGAMPDLTRDHGSIVPLYFLSRAFGGELPPILLASPIGLSPAAALALGKALATFSPGVPPDENARDLPGSPDKHAENDRKASTPGNGWAFVASGDLSHRLKANGPAGYRPEGAVFDKAVVRALKTGNPLLLSGLPQEVLTHAGECGLRSVLALLGLCYGPVEVLSYEGPFGVGYCNALWSPAPAGE